MLMMKKKIKSDERKRIFPRDPFGRRKAEVNSEREKETGSGEETEPKSKPPAEGETPEVD